MKTALTIAGSDSSGGAGIHCSSGYGTDRKPQEGNDHNRKYAEGQCEPAL